MPRTTGAPGEASGGHRSLLRTVSNWASALRSKRGTKTATPRSLLNDELIKHTQPTPRQFPHFMELPREIRHQIWTLTLPRQRWLPLVLEQTEYSFRVQKPSDLYTLSLESKSQASNTLLHVNDPVAMQVFLKHYRVQLPLKPLEPGAESVLYLRPEDDIVHILEMPNGGILAAFLHDVLAADRRRVGLCNLAGQEERMGSLYNLSEDKIAYCRWWTRDVGWNIIRALREVLENLRRFYAVARLEHKLRNPSNEVLRNLSIPFWSQTLAFEWYDTDPRADIESDVGRVEVAQHPHALEAVWYEFELKFGLNPRCLNPNADFKMFHALALWPGREHHEGDDGGRPRLESRRDVIDFIERSDEDWDESLNKRGLPPRTDEARVQENSRPQVAGFWTFPAGSFRMDDEEPSMQSADRARRLSDLTDTRPGLGVFYLDP